jgi:hypothetical protein
MMPQVTRLKRSPASLFGAFVIALGVFVLWLLVSRELAVTSALTLALGAVVAAAIGVWIRVADL